MIENILELLKNELKGPILAQVAQALGLSDEKAKSSLEAAISAILAGVLQKASRPGGGESLVKTLKEGSYDGNLLHNLGSVLATGDGAQGLMRTGNSLLDGLFGDKLASVAGALATDLGLSKGPASSLLALAAPLVMSQIGKMAAAKGFNASALTDMLMSQKSHLLSAAPPGLAGALGLNSLADVGRDAQRKAAEYGSAVARTGAASVETTFDWTRWALPVGLLAALLIAIGIYALRPSDVVNPAGRPAVADAAEKAADNVRQDAAGAAEGTRDAIDRTAERTRNAANGAEREIAAATAGARDTIARAAEGTRNAANSADHEIAAAAAGARDSVTASAAGIKAEAAGLKEQLTAFTFPGGLKLELPENSGLAHFASYLQKPEPNATQTFALDDLQYEPGTSRLSASSLTTIDILAKILKVFSSVNIKLQGHATVASDSMQEKAEGLRRATEVKNLLVERGVDPNRIVVEGTESEMKDGKLNLVVTKL
jgi:outer membrane protein OmpA-like peptidoglycan-associated protein